MELGKVICVPDPDEAAARDEAMAAAVGRRADRRRRRCPASTTGVIHAGRRTPGTLFVQGTVGGRPFDDVHGAGWRLVTVDADPSTLDPATGRLVRVDRRPRRRPLAEPDDDATAAGSPSTTPPWALQRPDFHLYGTATTPAGAADAPRPPASPARHQPAPRRSTAVKLANVNGRAVLVLGDEIADVATASDGRFGPDPMAVYDDWDAFVDFAATVTAGTGPLVEADLRLPGAAAPAGVRHRAQLPQPRRGVGHGRPRRAGHVHEVPGLARRPVRRRRDRRRHASTGRSSSSPSSAAAPTASPRPTPGRTSPGSPSVRTSATATSSSRPARSSRSASPAAATARSGPWVVTPDELADPDDLALGCSVDGETVQDARTSDLIFGVPRLVAELSAVLPLLPGDVIFTGTPAGVGITRKPPRFLQPGEILEIVDRGHRHDPQPHRRRKLTMQILPLAPEPFTGPTDRDMLPSERREFVRTHRTCVFGTPRRADGPAMSIVYYVPTDTDELLVSTMRDRGKAKVVARNPKVSLCVLDERWPFSYLQVYCDATVDDDPDLVVDVMMAVGGRMSGEPLGDDARPFVAGHGRRGRPRRAPLPAVQHLRAATPPPPPQRPRRTAHPLGVGAPHGTKPTPCDIAGRWSVSTSRSRRCLIQ